MKREWIVAIIVLMSVLAPVSTLAASQLAPGDIAILQYRTDSPDGFGFVALVDLEAGTEIHFTNKGWDALRLRLARGEEVWRWHTASALPKATVVTCGGPESNSTHLCTEGNLILPEGDTTIQGFSNDGDQLLAFQGPISSPNLLYGLSTTPWLTPIDLAAGQDIDDPTSYVPLGLIDGVTAVVLSRDNGYYNGPVTDTKYELLKRIGAPGLWQQANTSDLARHPFQPPSFWDALTVLGPFITTAPVLNPSTVRPPALSGVIDDPTDPARQTGIHVIVSDPSATVTATQQEVPGQPFAEPALDLTGAGTSWNLKFQPTSAIGYSMVTIKATDANGNIDATFLLYAVSAAAPNPNATRFHTGASDASTVIDVGQDHMLVGNDEDQVIRLYHRLQSHLPIRPFDLSAHLQLDDKNGDGVPREVDIEASIRHDNQLYWIGSHGNSNRDEANTETNPGGECRPNRNRIIATTVVGTGALTQLTKVKRYDHLRHDLINWDNMDIHGKGQMFYGFDASVTCVENGPGGIWPKRADGFNIEGLAWAPGSTKRAYVAFRAPLVPVSDRAKALIIPITNFTSLFATDGGEPGSAEFGAPIELDLNAGNPIGVEADPDDPTGRIPGALGIRSLTRVGSDQYLIVAGAPDNENNFQLFTWTGLPQDSPQLRITEPDLISLNAGQPSSGAEGGYEAILVPGNPNLDNSGTTLDLILDNGRSNWYGDGAAVESKKLPPNLQKFRRDRVVLGPRLAMGFPRPARASDCPDSTSTPLGIRTSITGSSQHKHYEYFYTQRIEPARRDWVVKETGIPGQHSETPLLDCGGPGTSATGFYVAAILADPDRDGLSSAYKVLVSHTDPENADTDGNGTRDGDEDPDADELTHAEEYNATPTLPMSSQPTSQPTTIVQGVGREGFDPCLQGHPDPLNADTDGDGILDGEDTFVLDPAAWFDNDCDGRPDQPLLGASNSQPPLREDDVLTLTVAVSGTGTIIGAVVPGTSVENLEFQCPPTCEAAYFDHTQVTLDAIPNPGAVLVEWRGGGCGKTATCTVTLNESLAVTAVFQVESNNIPVQDVEGLIVAMQTANQSMAETTIELEAGLYTLERAHNSADGPNGLPSVVGQLTLSGSGAEATIL